MTSRGRPPKDNIKDPRRVADATGRALRDHYPPPEKPFSEDIVEEIQDFLKRHTEGPCDLGVYNEAEDRSRGGEPASLGGRAQAIRFPEYWHRWFAKQNETRLTTIDELVDARLEREVLRKFFLRLKHAAIAAVIMGAAGAHWFSDQIAWFVEKLPVLREFWRLIRGSGKA